MAWTINNGKLYFNTELYTGNASSSRNITGVGFQPDWTWIKSRNTADYDNMVTDVVRAAPKMLKTNSSAAEDASPGAGGIGSFDSDGFTIATGGINNTNMNNNGTTYVGWNWLAAGTAPSNTYAVKVVSDSGNKYRFDDFGTNAVTLEISEGGTFTFDQSDSSNNGHPLRFATQADGANSSQYTTGVTTNGTPGNAGAYTRITVAASAPTLFYYCTNHTGMGGQANTPVTNSFSNFAGTIKSNISPNTTSGFSIVSYTGTGSNASVGHGLNSAPKMIIVKSLGAAESWFVYHADLTSATYTINLDTTGAQFSNASTWNSTAPSSSVFSIGTDAGTNGSSVNFIAYCFNDVQGYLKCGSYTGNGNADGPFVHTGFKPSFVLGKRTDGAGGWWILDSKRPGFNLTDEYLLANDAQAEASDGSFASDFLANGWKARATNGNFNASGGTYIYMAFSENPFTSSAGTPVTAR